MIKWVSDFIDNPTPIYTSSQQGEIYFPKRILIEAEKAGKALRFDRLQANSLSGKTGSYYKKAVFRSVAPHIHADQPMCHAL